MKKTESILKIEHLNKKIEGQKIIDDLSFQIEKGDIYGFLGPNGAGKTTTLRMIMRLVFPTSGKIFINGKSIEKEPLVALSKVGSIIENLAFYLNMTAFQNLKLSASLSLETIKNSRISEVLAIVGLSHVKDKQVKKFSLGMKQRLGLANALLCNPSLIILDEPTNGVDPQGLRELKTIIKDLAKKEGITFLISSHMLREMEDLCNKTAFIQRGKIVEFGETQALFNKYHVTNLEDLFFTCIEVDRS
ncbi:ABC transporter [Enterococcus durans IPLA 655]|uniref:ABC transporter ATP-binding protein n=1 Tax=Enterococcus durans TaxID=53345 RepID=UPI000328754C|nr:ATP-binding cassette domain-containing protein [Enterococcus durans]EMS74326.1 ABC transporter [Enterococcus durans IPLA 655]